MPLYCAKCDRIFCSEMCKNKLCRHVELDEHDSHQHHHHHHVHHYDLCEHCSICSSCRKQYLNKGYVKMLMIKFKGDCCRDNDKKVVSNTQSPLASVKLNHNHHHVYTSCQHCKTCNHCRTQYLTKDKGKTIWLKILNEKLDVGGGEIFDRVFLFSFDYIQYTLRLDPWNMTIGNTGKGEVRDQCIKTSKLIKWPDNVFRIKTMWLCVNANVTPCQTLSFS